MPAGRRGTRSRRIGVAEGWGRGGSANCCLGSRYFARMVGLAPREASRRAPAATWAATRRMRLPPSL